MLDWRTNPKGASGLIVLAGVAAAYYFSRRGVSIYILIAAGVAASFVYKRGVRSARQVALAALAPRLGLSYDPGDGWMKDSELVRAVLVANGGRASVSNILVGSVAGDQMTVFDFSQKIRQMGGGAATVSLSVAAFGGGAAHLPRFRLGPETVLDKIVSAVGGQDIDIEEFPAFSKAYRLRGEDEDEVRRLFTDDVVGTLDPERRWVVWTTPKWLLMFWNTDPRLTDTVEVGAILKRLAAGGLDIEAMPDFIEKSKVVYEALIAASTAADA